MAIRGIARKDSRHTSVSALIEFGKEKGYVLFDEIHDILPDEMVALPEELDAVLSAMSEADVPTIRQPESYLNCNELASTSTEFEKNDEVPAKRQPRDYEKTSDPVRMYLREMGTVPLFNRL